MNTVLLNTVHLDGAPIIKKVSGEGGGSTILNQSKSVEITENGTTEVTAANGFLSKVVVNTNVASSGGGSDMPVIGDGKTYLYIKIAAKGRMDVPLCFSQTVANGVTIDWGDGSETQTLSGTGNVNTTHTYAEIGEYTISLNPSGDCTLDFGHNSYTYCVMGSAEDSGKVYCNMLQALEIGNSVTSIDSYAFQSCYSLTSVVIPSDVTNIGKYAFSYCVSLASIVIPSGVTSIGDNAFRNCAGMAYCDFSQHTSIPAISSTTFRDIPSDCKIIVPQTLYDEWVKATNWSSLASQIIKKSDWDASQS